MTTHSQQRLRVCPRELFSNYVNFLYPHLNVLAVHKAHRQHALSQTAEDSMSTLFHHQDVHQLSSLSRNHALSFFSDWQLYNVIEKETEESTDHKGLTSPLSGTVLSLLVYCDQILRLIIKVVAELFLL